MVRPWPGVRRTLARSSSDLDRRLVRPWPEVGRTLTASWSDFACELVGLDREFVGLGREFVGLGPQVRPTRPRGGPTGPRASAELREGHYHCSSSQMATVPRWFMSRGKVCVVDLPEGGAASSDRLRLVGLTEDPCGGRRRPLPAHLGVAARRAHNAALADDARAAARVPVVGVPRLRPSRGVEAIARAFLGRDGGRSASRRFPRRRARAWSTPRSRTGGLWAPSKRPCALPRSPMLRVLARVPRARRAPSRRRRRRRLAVSRRRAVRSGATDRRPTIAAPARPGLPS